MCGICGIVFTDSKRPVGKHILHKMASKIVHRGPDDEGFFFEKNVGLAIRRLSIIDIKGGQQPIFNEDQSIVTVYNGEIYNYLEIKKKLEKKGHIFRTNCDTEILVHLYEEYGNKMVHHLNGMFAFAVYDRRHKKLLLARDRLGIKPLYYSFTKDWFLFGSEIKSFSGFKDFSPDINYEALHHYLTFRFVPAPMTLFKSVKKLPPGFTIEYTIGKTSPKLSKYWDLCFENGKEDYSLKKASDTVRYLIIDAVKIRLMSEVPLGVMLSGGIDSSVIVSSMKSANQPNTSSFTITYEEEGDHNEGMFAKIAAEAFKTDHREITVRMDDFIENLEKMVYFMDEPIGDPAAIPIFDLCRFSRDYVTVLLSGVGGDELFAGYNVYKEAIYSNYLKRIPLFAWNNFILPVAGLIPEGTPGKNFINRARQPVEDVFLGSSFIYGGFSEDQKERLYTKDFAENQRGYNSHNIIRQTLERMPHAGRLHKMMYVDTKHWLADSHLIMMDKMSMANSMELRAPFLDHRLVEFITRMPESLKTNIFKSKILLKNAFSSDLPETLINRPKRGFSTPIDIWFKRSENHLAEFLFNKDSLPHEYFDKHFIKRIIHQHYKGKGDFSASLFSLLVLAVWIKKSCDF